MTDSLAQKLGPGWADLDTPDSVQAVVHEDLPISAGVFADSPGRLDFFDVEGRRLVSMYEDAAPHIPVLLAAIAQYAGFPGVSA